MSKLGERISSTRKAKGYSQEKLAEEAKINLRTLQRVEKGITTPHGETLKRISVALDIPIEDIMQYKSVKKFNYLTIINIIILIFLICIFLFTQGKWSISDNKVLITKRIQYDVPIVKEDANYIWWLENIEVSERMTFVNNLFEKALLGEVKICDMNLNPINPDQLQVILTDSLLVSVEKPTPTFEEFDTILIHHIEPVEIDLLTFLEEWNYNKDNLVMEKRILGICLVKKVEYQGHILKKPLFWIYFDEVILQSDYDDPLPF